MAAAKPEELAEEAPPDAVTDAVADVEALLEGDESLPLRKVSWLVTTAVKPVALVQLVLTEELTPATKFTAAHYQGQKSVYVFVNISSSFLLTPHLVQNAIRAFLDDLNKTGLACEFLGGLEIG